ncbi:hypothetical protein D0Z07_9272 [Hyphodiscus hymeniophilus]|uniref:Glycoside hydrolase 131 catalytic N-terminal domain-containing protein n=1 Tax=Hyphodiscus hymeniophilus TaxID=353542 RepID=A0A9P6SPX9_9HELO|nr:hypothetical protein D0Z07_9272 [Hyphodiscus hymeniophilus]
MFSLAIVALAGSAASTVLWDGRFNGMSSSTDLNEWSWSDEVGPYQYYIHGSETVTSYVNLSPSYKNPADSGSTQGVKITLDGTSYWNGQTMRRTELIPQTTAAINSGKVWYHFSMMMSATNPPSIYREHQINFFESHFTEMKAGWISGESGTSDNLLRWDVSSTTHWSTPWVAGVWHNVAYEIDFTGGSVAFWHSTGSDPLTLTVAAVSISASSNGEDWHLGVLELPVNGQADGMEDYYFSGVYVESGSLTTSVAGPGGVVGSSSASSSPTTSSHGTTLSTSVTSKSSTTVITTKGSSTSVSSKSSSAASSSSSAAGGTAAKW